MSDSENSTTNAAGEPGAAPKVDRRFGPQKQPGAYLDRFVTFKLRPDDADWLFLIAESREQSMSSLVRELVDSLIRDAKRMCRGPGRPRKADSLPQLPPW